MKASHTIAKGLALVTLLSLNLQPATAFAQSGSYTNWNDLVTNWIQTSAPDSQDWFAIASSADGTKLAAVIYPGPGGIYTSTNSGVTWTTTGSAPAAYWQCIASSADGTKLAAGSWTSGIWISTNSGAMWTQASATGTHYYSIASSADGTKFSAVAWNNGIYTSTNSGVTWTKTGSAPAIAWSSIASSADGTELAAAANDGGIWISTNSGVIWTQNSASGTADWMSIASSADGTELAAVVSGGGIWISTNSGNTWIQTSAPGTAAWYSIASSADGTKLAAVVYGGGIWTAQATIQTLPSLSIITNIPVPSYIGNLAVNPALNKIYLAGGEPVGQMLAVDGITFATSFLGNGGDVGVDTTNNNYWSIGLYSGNATVWNTNDAAVTNISLGYCPSAVNVDAPHRVVWVGAQCGPGSDPVWAINADTYAIIAGPIGSGGAQNSLVVNPATGRLYINPSGVSKRVNPSTYAVTSNAFGTVIGVNASANLLYAEENGTTLQIINGAPDPEVILTNITLPFSAYSHIGVNPTLNRIYIGSSSSNLLVVLNAANGSLIQTISLDSGIGAVGNIAVDASRNRIYAIAYGGGSVYLCVIQDNNTIGQGPIIPPTVTITNPVDGAIFSSPTNITINASASDADGTVTKVAFLAGTNQLGTLTSGPYSFVWTNAPIGTNVLNAVATDNLGLSTTSAPVSVVVQPSVPQVALVSPTNNNSFLTNASILVSAVASDADNALAQVELYAQAATNNAQPFLLSAITNPPYNFTWSGMVAGTYTLTALAVDSYGPVATSAPVNITVTIPPPLFLFSSANYSVNESDGAVVVTVLNNGDLGGLVNYTTADGTAFGGSGFSGSYTIAQGALFFASGQHSTNITIVILDNYLDGPDIQFSVQLFGPSTGTLGTPSTTTVTIHQNDIGGATNSLLAYVAPSLPQPSTSGALTLVLTPPEAGGQWRFLWEQGWHQSGDTESSLQAGNYPVQFRDVPNYLAYPATVTIAITNNGTTIVTNQLLPTYMSLDTNSTGSLTVNIWPNAPPGSGWRFIGESTWRSNNTSASGLLPDTYFIQFNTVNGWASPASQAVQVFSGQGTIVTANYLSATPLPSGPSEPSPISPTTLITDIRDYPYGFNGQLYTDVGYGSGVAVRESVVLTAAHMVFNDATLAYVNQAYWSFQEEQGTFSPEPLPARGWYVLSGYAAQRTNDLPPLGSYGVDQSSPQSRNLDVAALYFLLPAARGGYGGYLASDASPNPWLTNSNLKMLVGYPVDGSEYGQVLQPGTMYATAAAPNVLTPLSNNVYSASWLLSYPGNSGGPLYVQFNGYYYPAAVYLGSLGSGQNAVSVVRAINSDVVNLINLAASEGDAGTNYTGGGVITIIPNQAINANNPGYVQLQLGPPAAVRAGAAWRLQGDTAWSTATNYTEAVLSTNAIGVQFKPITGWNLPANQSVTVVPQQIVTPIAFYTVTNPVLVANATLGIGIMGTTGTVYEIESRTSLTSGSWAPLSTNTITANGFNLVLPKPGTNGTTIFYRAVWLGQ